MAAPFVDTARITVKAGNSTGRSTWPPAAPTAATAAGGAT